MFSDSNALSSPFDKKSVDKKYRCTHEFKRGKNSGYRCEKIVLGYEGPCDIHEDLSEKPSIKRVKNMPYCKTDTPNFWDLFPCFDIVKHNFWVMLNNRDFVQLKNTNKQSGKTLRENPDYELKNVTTVNLTTVNNVKSDDQIATLTSNYFKVSKLKVVFRDFDRTLKKYEQLVTRNKDLFGKLKSFTLLYENQVFTKFFQTKAFLDNAPTRVELNNGNIDLCWTDKIFHDSTEVIVSKTTVSRIDAGFLPKNLKVLHLNQTYMIRGALPEGLVELSFTPNYYIEKDNLPKTLKKLFMGCNRHLPVDQEGCLPEGLTHLTIRNLFKEEDHKRYFSENWTRAIGAETVFYYNLLPNLFPISLEYLDLGRKFNQDLQANFFPDNLKSLTFFSFNKSLKRNILPAKLEYLDMGLAFNKELDAGVLPETLKTLKLGNFGKDIRVGVLPANLEVLEFHFGYRKDFGEGALPENLKELIMSGYLLPGSRKFVPHGCKLKRRD